MGEPAQPSSGQYAALEKAGQLAEPGVPENLKIENAAATVKVKLPRQAVTLLIVEWDGAAR